MIFEREDGDYDVAIIADTLRICAGDPRCLKDKLEVALKHLIDFSPSLVSSSSRLAH